MKTIFKSSLLLIPFLVMQKINAQDCTPQLLAQKPGQWKKLADVNGNFPGAELSRAKKMVGLLSKVMFDVYPQPKGCEARWYESYSSSIYDIGLLPAYEFTSLYLMYYCKSNKKDFVVGDETDDWIYIKVNYCGWLNDFLTVNGKKYWTMKRPTEVKDGILSYIYPNSSSSFYYSNKDTLLNLWNYAWLITYPGKLPYIPVNRKEYLLEARQEVVKKQSEMTESEKKNTTIRPAAEQEAAKQKEVEYYKKNYPDNPRRWQRYLEDYKTDEQRLQASIDYQTKQYQATLKIMDDLLKNLSAEELQKPAIVSEMAKDFKGFEDDFNERNANMLIRWNPDYFNKKLPVATPQFFTIVLRENPADIPAEELSRQFRQKFDFKALAALLGK